MARIRTIKPELWSDEKFAECSASARLLFVASLNFADDNGNLDRSARQLKAQAFPYDAIDCEPLIIEMLRVGMFVEYGVADKFYLHIKNFQKHQRIDRHGPARCPLYEDSARTRRTFADDSTTIRRIEQAEPQIDDSSNVRRAFVPVREGKGRDKEKDTPRTGSPEGAESRAARSTASRLPADFTLTIERSMYATEQGIDPVKTFANFVDYWKAAAGAKARKQDWDATWRMWCRNQAERDKGKAGGRLTRYEQLAARLENGN